MLKEYFIPLFFQHIVSKEIVGEKWGKENKTSTTTYHQIKYLGA